ncbi:uncharacterized protein [Periplaneta americana]|uniref:uncharacterized protein isoform X3 n=1 Tax=Periplaneta americana TaxID=6978 RepID=UPI0037E8F929
MDLKLEDYLKDMDVLSITVTPCLPDRLCNLAMKRMGRYVSDLMVFLATGDLKTSDMKKMCEPLRDIVQNKVPPYYANEVVDELLTYIDSVFQIVNNYSREEKILNMVLKAVCHTSMTAVDLVKDRHHLSVEYRKYRYVPAEILNCFQKLENLKSIRLPSMGTMEKDTIGRHFFVTKNLQEFSSSLCNDSMIKTLSKTCHMLKILDVSYSFVTNISIPFIKLFRHLEELNVLHSDITDEGMMKLLMGFSRVQTSQIFSYLGCCGLTSDLEINFFEGYPTSPSSLLKNIGCSISSLELIQMNFPNVTSLILYSVGISRELETMKNLTSLTINYLYASEYSRCQLPLTNIATHIVQLDISKCELTDLVDVITYMTSLKCLHVEMEVYYDYMGHDIDVSDFSLPENKSIRCFCLRSNCKPVTTEYFLSKLVNLNYLYLYGGLNCESKELFHSLFLRQINKRLQQFVIFREDSYILEVSFPDQYLREVNVRCTRILDSEYQKSSFFIEYD